MPTVDELFSRINTKLVYPPFLRLARQLVENLLEKGVAFYATCGERTFPQQDELYQKGRRGIEGEMKVTNAKAGWSAHNYGLAIDFCKDGDLDKVGLQPIWKSAEYKILADEAKKLGLDPGYYWKSISDGPHVQLDLQGAGLSIAQLRDIYIKEHGKAGVWDLLEGYDWSAPESQS